MYSIHQVKLHRREADASLVIYAVIEIVGLLLLAIYIAHKTLIDTRNNNTV